ncbi:MAG: hypothetical protein HRU17_18890 [Polyangiaceae bacterium]|nr:hypothetical protein [Polyangiaceae bacterium]
MSDALDALVAAKHRAVDAAEKKNESLASMTHEIRTPMNTVLGLLELLLDTPARHSARRRAATGCSPRAIQCGGTSHLDQRHLGFLQGGHRQTGDAGN